MPSNNTKKYYMTHSISFAVAKLLEDCKQIEDTAVRARYINAVARAAGEIAKGLRLRLKCGGVWEVQSRTHAGQHYEVSRNGKHLGCTCAAAHNGNPCHHTAAVRIMQIALAHKPEPKPEAAARPAITSERATAVQRGLAAMFD